MISYCSIKLKKRKIIASIFTRKKNKREWFLISQDIILPPFTFVFSSNQKGKKYLSFLHPINRQFPIRQFIYFITPVKERQRGRKHGWRSLWMPRGQNANCTDLVTLTIQHWRRLSLPPLENAVPRARNRLSLIIASLLRTVASHRFHSRYWQCKLLITLSRPRIAIVASGSRALHACMQRDGHGAYITSREDPQRPNKGAKSPRPA